MRTLRLLLLPALGVALLLWGHCLPAQVPDPVIETLIARVDLVRMHADIDTLVDMGTRRFNRPGAVQAQNFLYGRFQTLGWQDLLLHDFDAYADNVVATLPGLVAPDEIWVLGAHYDSINGAGPDLPAPGADDNGTGVAGLLEVARILAESGVRFEATIVLVGFASEEVGRIGSAAFVDAAITNGDDIRGGVVMDVLGYLEPGTDLDISFGTTEDDPLVSEDLVNAADLVVETYLPDFVRDVDLTCG